MAAAVADRRQSAKVRHEVLEMFRQRVYGIAAGYPDVRDADRPHRTRASSMPSVGRGPLRGADLASAATLCRFERTASRPASLAGMMRALASGVIDRLRRRCPKPRRLVLDFDPAVDRDARRAADEPVRRFLPPLVLLADLRVLVGAGAWESNTWCGLGSGRAASPTRGFLRALRRITGEIRQRFGRRVEILVRLDAAFAKPIVLDTLEDLGLKYVVCFASNPILKRWVAPHLRQVRRQACSGRGLGAPAFFERRYQAVRWTCERRSIAKVEVTARKSADEGQPALRAHQPRHVPTSHEPSTVLLRTRRGGEPHQGSLKCDLEIDRTSSAGAYVANQARIVLTATAYALMQEPPRASAPKRLRPSPGRAAAAMPAQDRRLCAGVGAPNAAPAGAVPVRARLANRSTPWVPALPAT
ncbi:MAG: transposase [Planctomycetota bacterium]